MKEKLIVFVKGLKGIPVAIFLYEMLNLTISIILNEYVRLDGFKLNELIIEYLELAIMGYGTAFMINYTKYISEKTDKSIIKKSKNVVDVFGITMILVILIISFIEKDFLIGLIIISMISLIIATLLFIIYLFDERDIKSINKKIKESKN